MAHILKIPKRRYSMTDSLTRQAHQFTLSTLNQ